MWEERFAQSDTYVFGTEPAQFLVEHTPYLVTGQRALSVADGEGRNAVYMAKQGLDVTALEFAPSAVARAKKLAQTHRVALRHLNANMLIDDWVETQSYDLVVGIFIQFATPSERQMQFRDMQASCKPGGVVMLHGYTAKQIELGTGGPPFADRMYSEPQMRSDFQGWDILECRAYEREVQEGRGHSGMSALLDFVARRPIDSGDASLV